MTDGIRSRDWLIQEFNTSFLLRQSREKKGVEWRRRRGDNMSDYLVPGSIRLDCRLIEESERERGERRRRRRKKVDIPDMSEHRREQEEESKGVWSMQNVETCIILSIYRERENDLFHCLVDHLVRRLTDLFYIFWCDNCLNRDERISWYDETKSFSNQSLSQNHLQEQTVDLDRKQTLT